MPAITAQRAGSLNMCAFLDMITFSELGKGLIDHSDQGYDVIVGSYYRSDTSKRLDLMTSYRDHPNKLVDLPQLRIKSTAAGAYQILYRFWVAYKRQLGLPDFSPLSQDGVAMQLIRECGAVNDVHDGRFDAAVQKCRSRWASLPGAGYGQNEHTVAHLRDYFIKSGGSLV